MFTFAFITDPQIGMKSPHGLHADDSDRVRLDRSVDFINSADVDLVVFGGDHIDEVDSEEQRDLFLAGAGRLNVPWYGVRGNHDQDPVYATHEATPNRFVLNHKGCFFVGFNACALRGNFGPESQAAEWAYLRDAIGTAPADATHRFVIMHWPLFILHPDEEDSMYNMPNRHELAQFFTDSKITCVFSGHIHQDIDIVWEGVRLITSIGTSNWHHYPEETAFKLVTVFDGGFSVRRASAEGTTRRGPV
ncbi:MAG: metallophosphoesterase family protein [Lentisphaeria bacterium]|jgi:predicted phosphodiesterase